MRQTYATPTRLHSGVAAASAPRNQHTTTTMADRPPSPRGSSDAKHRFQAAMLAQMHDAVVAMDLGWRITYWNAAAERLFGVPADQAVGRRVGDVSASRWLEEGAQPAALEALARGESWTGEHILTTPSGEERWTAFSVSALHDEPGSITGYLTTIRDINARRQVEAERAQLLLREHAARAAADALAAERAAVLAQITDGVILTDAQGRITFVNEAARQLHGVSALGMPVAGSSDTSHLFTLAGEPYPPEELPVARAVQRGETVQDAQWRIRRPDGTEVVVEGSATPILAADGAQLGSALVLRDVTARHELQRQRDAFLASTSHDLQNPLTAIKGTAQVLRRLLLRTGAIAPAQLLEGLTSIDTSASHLAGQVGQLLDIAQLQMGQGLELSRQPTDLVALAADVVAQGRQMSERHRLELVTDETALVGDWDRDRLRRVLGNLVGNAIKYSPAGGAITVSVGREEDTVGSWAVVTVTDHGLGISAADLLHVFERFHRGANVTGRILGTGIGLADVRQVVEAHGGTVGVTSAEGAGSTFTLRLPLAPPDDAF
jgi:PAS domain S-box-containing protein